jgi:hypothetical protein
MLAHPNFSIVERDDIGRDGVFTHLAQTRCAVQVLGIGFKIAQRYRLKNKLSGP